MRKILATIILLVLVAGCGTDDQPTTTTTIAPTTTTTIAPTTTTTTIAPTEANLEDWVRWTENSQSCVHWHADHKKHSHPNESHGPHSTGKCAGA